ncbi:MAG: M43 family zinc metalloprotease [Minicystis sp.]
MLSFGPESSVSADAAPTHPTIQAALKQVDKSLGTVGVHVGNVTFEDIPDIPGTIELSGPACLGGSGTEEIFDLAPEPPPGVLHLIFTDRFHCLTSSGMDLGSAVGGVSNGIPGIPFARRDGMLLSTNLVEDYPDDWSLVLAHELSHFLGLFHTCEGGVDICDNIPDTPEGVGVLGAAANLMFPNVSASTSDGLTPQQGSVLRLSSLVHPM